MMVEMIEFKRSQQGQPTIPMWDGHCVVKWDFLCVLPFLARFVHYMELSMALGFLLSSGEERNYAKCFIDLCV